MSAFELLGVLVAGYVLHAVLSGEVFAKSGVWGRTVSRADSPTYYWAVVSVYAGLSLALLTIF